MGLPDSRDLTAVDGVSILPAATLNEMQDELVFLMNPGKYAELREAWRIAAATITAQTLAIADLDKLWSYYLAVADATQTLAYQDPVAGYGARSMKLNQGTSANNTHIATLCTAFAIGKVTAGMKLTFEVDVQLTTATLTSPGYLMIGLANAVGAIALGVGEPGFQIQNAAAVWSAGNNGAGTATTGATAIGGAFQRLKIKIDLGAGWVKYYLNDVLLLTDTANLPAVGNNIFPSIIQRCGLTGVCTTTIGEMVMRWSKF